MTPDTRISILEGMRQAGTREEAFRRFVLTYQRTLQNWCLARGLRYGDAEDLTQEILLRLWDRLRTFSYDPRLGRFRTWLRTVVNNIVVDYFRKLPRQLELPAVGGDAAQAFFERVCDTRPDPAPEVEALTVELEARLNTLEQEAVAHARVRVEPQTWEVYALLVIVEQSAEEVSRSTGLSRAAVYRVRHRVNEIIKQEYQRLQEQRRHAGEVEP